jgi:hypothetical protein
MVVTWLPNIETDDAPSNRRKVGFSLMSLLVPVLLEAAMVAI